VTNVKNLPFGRRIEEHSLIHIFKADSSALHANGYSFTFFFHLFFIANICLFCQKGKSLVLTALPFVS
jgi:hypothetical protein